MDKVVSWQNEEYIYFKKRKNNTVKNNSRKAEYVAVVVSAT